MLEATQTEVQGVSINELLVYLAVGGGFLWLGSRVKASFRWLIIFVGGLCVATGILFFVMFSQHPELIVQSK